jgi:CRP/FNR family transcriptional regulator
MAKELTRWLNALEPAARDTVASQAQMLLLPSGAELYAQGEPVDGIYMVLDGLVKETALSPEENNLQFLRLKGPGEVLGAGEVFSEPVHTMSAMTLRDTRLSWIEQSDLQKILKHHPGVLIWLMQNFSCQLGELRTALVETVYVESAARLTRKLIEVAERFGERTPHGLIIDLNLSRDEWAALVGMAPETVSRILHGLERRGWIALEGRQIRLIEEEKLRAQFASLPARDLSPTPPFREEV